MILAVRSDGVAFCVDLMYHAGIEPCPAANDEKGCLHAFGSEQIKHTSRIRREWSVVESKHNFLVSQRQSFGILRSANAWMLGRIDRKCAAYADRIRIGGAVGGIGGCKPEKKPDQCEQEDAYDFTAVSHLIKLTPTTVQDNT